MNLPRGAESRGDINPYHRPQRFTISESRVTTLADFTTMLVTVIRSCRPRLLFTQSISLLQTEVLKFTCLNRQYTAPASSSTPAPSAAPKKPIKKQETWAVQKQALQKKFKEGWAPPKRLSPDAIEGVRELHRQDPQKFSTPVLAEHFKVSPEAIRRILKSKWRPSEKEIESRKERWEKRKVRIWNQMAELGLRPQRKAFVPFSDSEQLKK